MVNIFGKILLQDKVFYIELSKIFGIGYRTSLYLCEIVGLNVKIRVKKVPKVLLKKIIFKIKKDYKIEGSLKNDIVLNIQKQFEMHSYKAYRRLNNLPVNGQRTKTNAKTAKKLNKIIGYRNN